MPSHLWHFAASATEGLPVLRSRDSRRTMAANMSSSSDNESDPTGVDITRTEVHRSPYQDGGSDDDVSVQSDFAAGVDIPYQAAFPADVDAFLSRRDSEESDDSRDMEIPDRKPLLQGGRCQFDPYRCHERA